MICCESLPIKFHFLMIYISRLLMVNFLSSEIVAFEVTFTVKTEFRLKIYVGNQQKYVFE